MDGPIALDPAQADEADRFARIAIISWATSHDSNDAASLVTAAASDREPHRRKHDPHRSPCPVRSRGHAFDPAMRPLGGQIRARPCCATAVAALRRTDAYWERQTASRPSQGYIGSVMTEFDYATHFKRFSDAATDASQGRFDIERREAFFAQTCTVVGPDGIETISSADLPGLMRNPFGLPHDLDQGPIRVRSVTASPLSATTDRVVVDYAVGLGDDATVPRTVTLTYMTAMIDAAPRIWGILVDSPSLTGRHHRSDGM